MRKTKLFQPIMLLSLTLVYMSCTTFAAQGHRHDDLFDNARTLRVPMQLNVEEEYFSPHQPAQFNLGYNLFLAQQAQIITDRVSLDSQRSQLNAEFVSVDTEVEKLSNQYHQLMSQKNRLTPSDLRQKQLDTQLAVLEAITDHLIADRIGLDVQEERLNAEEAILNIQQVKLNSTLAALILLLLND